VDFNTEQGRVRACRVNYDDLAVFVGHWLASGSGLEADMYFSQSVDLEDYSVLAFMWLDYCPGDWQLK